MFLGRMNIQSSLMRDDIINAARRWDGVRWKHQGRDITGIDCAGIIIRVAKSLDIMPPEFDINGYARRSPHGKEFVKNFDKYLIRKKNKDKLPGDIVVFKEPSCPCHCGIIGLREGKLTVIHAHAPRKKVLEEFFIEKWENLLVRTYSFPGVK